MAESSLVTIPADVATHWAHAIKSARAGIVAVQPWLATQPTSTQMVVGRAVQWVARWIAVAEPLIVQSEKP